MKDSLTDQTVAASPTAGSRRSILHAQADEIRTSPEVERPTFQYAELQDWRDVALEVLGRIACQPSCAFEDTGYPSSESSPAIFWEEVSWEMDEWQSHYGRYRPLEIYALDWRIDKVALGHTLVRQCGCPIAGAAHLVGTNSDKASGAPAGLTVRKPEARG